MKFAKIIMFLTVVTFLSGCHTQGKFIIPEGSELYLYKRNIPSKLNSNGVTVAKPFFWTAAGMPPTGGVPYRLVSNGKTIKEGRLRAKFRVVSIFWPPFAIIYWPMGLNPRITYDLVNDKQE